MTLGAQPLALLLGQLSDASTLAPRVNALFWALCGVSALLIFILVALNLTFLIRYRRGSPAPRGPLPFSTMKIEAGWISATLAVFLGFFFWGASVYLDQERVPANAYVINVTGRQWMWDIRHPNGRREFDELHVPVSTPVRLLLSSEDVIHSFFVPAFRMKQDAVPGKQVSAWFEATQPGSYALFCTQYCGTAHASMTGRVVVMEPDRYAQWLAGGNQVSNIPIRGRDLFIRHGCAGCHSANSIVHAPPLEGVYGRLQPVENGQFVQADDAYLRDSILQPGQHIVAGYANVMPSFQGVIPEGDLLDLIAYLKSLGAAAPGKAMNLQSPKP
jgi:cytochrome c oxidase subunit 2